MAEKKEEAKPKSDKKPLDKGLIFQGAFAFVNLLTLSVGAYLVYASTLGWKSPSITEASLRNPASVKEAAPAAKPEAEAKPAEGGEKAEGGEGGVAKVDEDSEPRPFFQKLDKFTVNLGGEPHRTIRLEVNLELLNQESYEEVMDATLMPKIRDRIVNILNENSFSDLESIQGKLFLKEKITSQVNSILDQGVVKDVFFSEFVVQ